MTIAIPDSRTSQVNTQDNDLIASRQSTAEPSPEVLKLPAVATPSIHIEEAVRPADEVEGVPVSLLELYAEIALRHAVYEDLGEEGWFASVIDIEGAYGEGATRQEAEQSLREGIIGWVVVKRRFGAGDIPRMEGLDLNPGSVDD